MPKTESRKSKVESRKEGTKKQPALATSEKVRKLEAPKRNWSKPGTWKYRPAKPAYAPLPKAHLLFITTLRQLWDNKKLFAGIVAIYGLLDILLVRGLAGGENLNALKQSLDAGHGVSGQLATAISSFAYLVTNSNSGTTATSGVYQTVLLLVGSLAVIWALRQIHAKHMIRIRDCFYKGMYPLVPFFLVFLLMSVQLLPIAIGTSIYSVLIYNHILIPGWETILGLMVLIGIAVWSLRLITATIIALYVVTLPDMTPLQAYRSAKKLVSGRRLVLWLKFLFLIMALLLIAVLIEFPLVLFWTPGAVWVFFGLTLLALPAIHGYLYNLYREML